MGKSLSLAVVAQGVETRQQAELLRTHACDELQGFYFNRPDVSPSCSASIRDALRRSELH
jgi:EAL domain-containing protein (putative c-di-GMP-specific phosphodiesterase class I)